MTILMIKRRETEAILQKSMAVKKHCIHIHSPKDRKIRNLQVNQDFEGALQKANWRSSRSDIKKRGLDRSRSQCPTKAVNLETITDMLSWYRILPLNGFNLIRVVRKLLKRRKGVYKNSSNRRKSRRSVTLTSHWNLANLVTTCHGIIVLQHLIDPRQVAQLEERYAE